MSESAAAAEPAMSAPSDVAVGPVVVVGSQGRRLIDGDRAKVERCDFRHRALLSESESRRLRQQQIEFARQFSGKASSFLRLEFNLDLAGIETPTYAQFTGAVIDPAHLTLFRLEPLPGLGIISFPPPVGLAITNRMLGGKGEISDDSRPLTEIEVGLLEDFLRIFAEEWSRQWPDLVDPRLSFVGHETSGRFLQTSPPAAHLLGVNFDATLGDRRQRIQIALPFAALESSIRKGQGSRPREPKAAAPAVDQAAVARRAATAGICLPAIADWAVARVPLRDMLHLRAGDVLELSGETLARTRVSLTGRPLFLGTAGVRDGRVAVRLDRRLEEDEPIDGVGKSDLFSPLLSR